MSAGTRWHTSDARTMSTSNIAATNSGDASSRFGHLSRKLLTFSSPGLSRLNNFRTSRNNADIPSPPFHAFPVCPIHRRKAKPNGQTLLQLTRLANQRTGQNVNSFVSKLKAKSLVICFHLIKVMNNTPVGPVRDGFGRLIVARTHVNLQKTAPRSKALLRFQKQLIEQCSRVPAITHCRNLIAFPSAP